MWMGSCSMAGRRAHGPSLPCSQLLAPEAAARRGARCARHDPHRPERRRRCAAGPDGCWCDRSDCVVADMHGEGWSSGNSGWAATSSDSGRERVKREPSRPCWTTCTPPTGTRALAVLSPCGDGISRAVRPFRALSRRLRVTDYTAESSASDREREPPARAEPSRPSATRPLCRPFR